MDDENTTFKERHSRKPHRTRGYEGRLQPQISFWSFFFVLELAKLRPGSEKWWAQGCSEWLSKAVHRGGFPYSCAAFSRNVILSKSELCGIESHKAGQTRLWFITKMEFIFLMSWKLFFRAALDSPHAQQIEAAFSGQPRWPGMDLHLKAWRGNVFLIHVIPWFDFHLGKEKGT